MMVNTNNIPRVEVLKALLHFALKQGNQYLLPANNVNSHLSLIVGQSLWVWESIDENHNFKFTTFNMLGTHIFLGVDLTDPDGFDPSRYDAHYGAGAAQNAIDLYTLPDGQYLQDPTPVYAARPRALTKAEATCAENAGIETVDSTTTVASRTLPPRPKTMLYSRSTSSSSNSSDNGTPFSSHHRSYSSASTRTPSVVSPRCPDAINTPTPGDKTPGTTTPTRGFFILD